jgi:hypothetical protein
LLPLLLLAGACRQPAPAEDVVAEARSGAVRLPEIEVALGAAATPGARPAPSAGPSGAADDVDRYRKAAEALVVERAIVGDLGEGDRVFQRELGKDYERLRRDVTLELFEREADAARPIRVTDAEIERYFKAHPEEFHRQAQRFVWLIFRRHEDPARPQDTVAFLRTLKERVRKGEPFRILAGKYSQSETRLFDGRLGMMGRGRLPKPLDDVVFAVPKGGVSDPVLVGGGAVLFEVTEVFDEKRFALEDVRVLIADELRKQKRRERVDAALAGRKLPAGSVVLDREALRRQLESAPEDEVVLRVGGSEWTVKSFREAAASLPPDRMESLPGPAWPERQAELYEDLARQARLFEKLEAEAFAAAAQRQRAIAERLRGLGRAALLRRRMEDRIWKKVDADAGALRRFHEENKFLYQSPLRLKIRTLVVPLTADAPRKMAEMEVVRTSLAKGQLDLAAAARRLGGEVRDAVWVDPAAMASLDPKVRLYLLDMNGPGYTVPFQLNRQLNIVFVEQRQEPRLLPYEEVKDRVRTDYHDRKQQDLYQAVVAEVLQAERFRFHEDVVRRALGTAVARS